MKKILLSILVTGCMIMGSSVHAQVLSPEDRATRDAMHFAKAHPDIDIVDMTDISCSIEFDKPIRHVEICKAHLVFANSDITVLQFFTENEQYLTTLVTRQTSKSNENPMKLAVEQVSFLNSIDYKASGICSVDTKEVSTECRVGYNDQTLVVKSHTPIILFIKAGSTIHTMGKQL